MRVVVRGEQRTVHVGCMLGAWRTSNLLDSLTDAFYAGRAPNEGDFGSAIDALAQMKRECGVETDHALELLAESSNLAGLVGNLEEAKKSAGAARTEMQKLLEGAT